MSQLGEVHTMLIKNGSIVYLSSTQEMVTVRGVKAATNQVYIERANGKREWVSLNDVVARPKILKTTIENGVVLSVPNPSAELHKTFEDAANQDEVVTKTGPKSYKINNSEKFMHRLDTLSRVSKLRFAGMHEEADRLLDELAKGKAAELGMTDAELDEIGKKKFEDDMMNFIKEVADDVQ